MGSAIYSSEYYSDKMKFIPLVFCLALISLIETTIQAKIFKPKLNLVQSQNFKSPITNNKLPEERRKLSLFPKSKKKFVVQAEPSHKYVANNPAVPARKKPLMKKIVLQDKNPYIWNSKENETKQPKMRKELFSNNLSATQNLEPVIISEEVSIKVDKEESEESYKVRIDNIVADNILPKDNNEFITTAPYLTNKNLKVNDFILTPKNNPVEINQENKNDSSHIKKNIKHEENADLEEFIFLDPLPSPTEIVMMNSEESDEFITTEIPEEPKFFRRRRSSNIIEEENLATTMVGYKYTWKDTKLDNNLVFRNINS